jgi:hypothetical protein
VGAAASQRAVAPEQLEVGAAPARVVGVKRVLELGVVDGRRGSESVHRIEQEPEPEAGDVPIEQARRRIRGWCAVDSVGEPPDRVEERRDAEHAGWWRAEQRADRGASEENLERRERIAERVGEVRDRVRGSRPQRVDRRAVRRDERAVGLGEGLRGEGARRGTAGLAAAWGGDPTQPSVIVNHDGQPTRRGDRHPC